MFKKTLTIVAFVGALAISPALAQQGCPNGCHGRFTDEAPVEQVHFTGPSVHFREGPRVFEPREHFDGGFRRPGHFWQGRWWLPGVGPCWRWTPVGWVWVCE